MLYLFLEPLDGSSSPVKKRFLYSHKYQHIHMRRNLQTYHQDGNCPSVQTLCDERMSQHPSQT